jgi:hypothetical protein
MASGPGVPHQSNGALLAMTLSWAPWIIWFLAVASQLRPAVRLKMLQAKIDQLDA